MPKKHDQGICPIFKGCDQHKHKHKDTSVSLITDEARSSALVCGKDGGIIDVVLDYFTSIIIISQLYMAHVSFGSFFSISDISLMHIFA